MSAPAAAFVGVAQFFARWSTPFEYVAIGQPVLPGSYTPGTSAAAAVPASARAQTATAATNSFFKWWPPLGLFLEVHLPGPPRSMRGGVRPL